MPHQTSREKLHKKCSKQVYRKVGENRLIKIIEEKVVKLLKQNKAACVDSVFDASFIKACSTRDPLDSQMGYSDREARVGRAGRTFGLCYKLHLSIDSKTMLPFACIFTRANLNKCTVNSVFCLVFGKLALKTILF